MGMRPTTDTEGLVVIRHTWRIKPQHAHAEGLAGPQHFDPIEERAELPDPNETVGQLIARLGLNEGDDIVIRWPTVAEDRARMAELLKARGVR